MMKVSNLSIILIISIIQQCCFGFERIYINFIPFSNSDCSGSTYSGIGYSGAIETCLTIDNVNNFKFEVSKEFQITYSIFNAGDGGSITCDEANLISKNVVSANSCVSSNTLSGINSNYQPLSPFFYKVIVSPDTFIASNSFVDTYLVGDCDNDMDIVLADYITNDTMARFVQSGSTYKYTCINGQPFTSNCKNNKCAQPISAALECYNNNPFFNGSSFEQPCSSGSGSQTSTSGNSNSCIPAPFVASSIGSGSGAVSSGAVATASSGTSGSSGVSSSTSTSSSSTTSNSHSHSSNSDITFFHNTFCS